MIIATVSANIRLERRYLCDHPILRPALLTLDDRAESGLSKEPWIDPVCQGLMEIGVPGCSGRATVMVYCLFPVICLHLLLLVVIVHYRTYKTADTKPQGENSFI